MTVKYIICVVYGDLHYSEAVQLEAERSMLASVAEVQALPHYAQDGEVCSLSVICHHDSLCWCKVPKNC